MANGLFEPDTAGTAMMTHNQQPLQPYLSKDCVLCKQLLDCWILTNFAIEIGESSINPIAVKLIPNISQHHGLQIQFTS